MKRLLLTATLILAAGSAQAATYHLDYSKCAGTGSDGTVYPAVFPVNVNTPDTGDLVSTTFTNVYGVTKVTPQQIRHWITLNEIVGPDDVLKCSRFTTFMGVFTKQMGTL